MTQKIATPTKHQSITNVISWFYTNIRGYKPDAREYKMEYKRIEALMFPDKEKCVGYTDEQVIAALEELDSEGIVMQTLGILQFTHLLPSLVRGNAVFKRQMLGIVKKSQKEKGLSIVVQDKPDGW